MTTTPSSVFYPIPKISASLFKWTDGVGTANASDTFSTPNKIPSTFQMISPKTNKIKTFTYNVEEAIQNESWDGEFSKYSSKCGLVAVIWNY
jgi:hypothetical protein